MQPLILAVSILTAIAQAEELNCDGDYTQNQKWCYMLMSAANNYTIASQKCKEKEGYLASVHNVEENIFLTAFGVDLFLGLEFNPKTKNYSWTDGTPVDIQIWESNYPMNPDYFGDCVVLQKSGKWINSECNWKVQYVCKKAVFSHQCPKQPNNQFFDSGEVASPAYPGHYASGLSCSYFLFAKNYHTVTVDNTVNEMGTGDVIEIFSGLAANNDYRIGVIKGNQSSGSTTFTTSAGENKMLVKFTSRSPTGGYWKFDFHSSADCETGWVNGGEAGLGYCYMLDRSYSIFEHAESACNKLGGHLISIQNAFQNAFVADMVKNNEDATAWLGIVVENEQWHWTDGHDSKYRNWAPGQPNFDDGECARMLADGKWVSTDCDGLVRPLCYKS